MSYDLKLFTGYRSGIYSYATKTTEGYADIDFFDYERTPWNEAQVVEPNEFGWYSVNGFEGSSDKWTGRGSAVVSSSSDASFVGNNSLYVSERESAWNGATIPLSKNIYQTGESYSFSANVMYSDGENLNNFFLKLQYVGADGETYYSTVAEGAARKNQWIQLSNSHYTIPDGATDMYLYVETESGTDSFYVDEVITAIDGTGILGADKPIKLLPADLNFDGIIDVFDLCLAREGAENGFDSATVTNVADVDKNGEFDENDLILIQDFLLGKINVFTENEV
jgi:hypothetical protein